MSLSEHEQRSNEKHKSLLNNTVWRVRASDLVYLHHCMLLAYIWRFPLMCLLRLGPVNQVHVPRSTLCFQYFQFASTSTWLGVQPLNSSLIIARMWSSWVRARYDKALEQGTELRLSKMMKLQLTSLNIKLNTQSSLKSPHSNLSFPILSTSIFLSLLQRMAERQAVTWHKASSNSKVASIIRRLP